MNVREENHGSAILLSPEGRLDSNTSQGFEELLMKHIEAGNTRLAVDFTDLDYISSAGLRVLLMAAKRIKAANGSLVLSGMQEHVHEVFEISGFLSILTVVNDAETAIATANG